MYVYYTVALCIFLCPILDLLSLVRPLRSIKEMWDLLLTNQIAVFVKTIITIMYDIMILSALLLIIGTDMDIQKRCILYTYVHVLIIIIVKPPNKKGHAS